MRSTARDALEAAILAAGGAAKLARKLAVCPSTVSQWRARGRVSVGYATSVEVVTGIPRERLRPDVFHAVPANKRPDLKETPF